MELLIYRHPAHCWITGFVILLRRDFYLERSACMLSHNFPFLSALDQPILFEHKPRSQLRTTKAGKKSYTYAKPLVMPALLRVDTYFAALVFPPCSWHR